MLAQMPGALFLVLFLLQLPPDRQQIPCDLDVDLTRTEAGHYGLYHDIVIGLVHVNRKSRPGRPAIPGEGERARERIVEKPIHCIAQSHEIRGRFPTRKVRHGRYLLQKFGDFAAL